MLFTRCPECDTTFRITEAALQKAHGQVRCGRCAHIFDAYSQLSEESELDVIATAAVSAELTAQQAPAAEDEGEVSPSSDDISESAENDQPAAEETDDAADWALADPESEDDPFASTPEPVPDPMAETRSDMTADEVQAVLEQPRPAPIEPAWMRENASSAAGVATARWKIAAGLAMLLLAGQTIHHFRAGLAGLPGLGPLLTRVYAWSGVELVPLWDVNQYDVVDWTALAEPGTDGRGTLVIRSRVRNQGPSALPHPYILLRLLDRREDTLGSRVFAPEEYLGAADVSTSMMAAGNTTEAELVIVDPGPDAYGFEIDLCVRAGGGFNCAADRVFE